MSNCCLKTLNADQPQASSVATFNKAIPVMFSIFGMSCASCEKTIKSVLSQISGVDSMDVDLNSNRALITGSFSVDDVITAIGKAGYIAELIPASADIKPLPEQVNKTGCCCR